MKKLIQILCVFAGALLLPHVIFADSLTDILSPTPGDVSIVYLQDIFGVVDGVLHGTGSQIMGAMFMVFNSGALALGSIIIMYTTLISTLNTAHQGEPLGKNWSSIWIPIRSALGIGLLVPKATGYSTIQIFLMWVVVQGVGLADHVWGAAIQYVTQGGMVVQSGTGTPDMGSTVTNVFKSEVCMFGMQSVMNNAYESALSNNAQQGATPVNVPPPAPALINSVIPFSSNPTCKDGTTSCVDFPGNSNGQTYDPGNIMEGVCGKITWDSSGSSEFQNLNQVAIQQIIMDLSGPAQLIISTIMPVANTTTSPPTVNTSQLLDPNIFVNAANDYQGIMEPYYASLVGGGGSMPVIKQMIESTYSYGWIMAGTFYPLLVSTNENIQHWTTNLPTVTIPSNFDSSCQTQPSGSGADLYAALPNLYQTGANTCSSLTTLTSYLNGTGSGSLAEFITNGNNAVSAAHSAGEGLNLTKGILSVFSGLTSGGVSGLFMLLFGPIGSGIIDIIGQFGNIATSEITNANPVIALAMMGGDLISIVATVWVVGGVAAAAAAGALGVIPCMTISSSVNALLMWIVPLLWGILGLLFVNGAVLAYYIPYIPFILFTFGALSWLISVIEAMVAGPLIALGITHPEGHEVLGKADPAVLLLVNVFLRPSMMVIGFIAGIILSYVGVWLLNRGFFAAAGQIIFQDYSMNIIALILSFPAVLILYTVLVIAVVNQAFALIYLVPDRVMNWLGSHGASNAGEMSQKALGEAKGAIESSAKGVSDGVQGAQSALNKMGAERKSSGASASKTDTAKGQGDGSNLASTSSQPQTPQGKTSASSATPGEAPAETPSPTSAKKPSDTVP